MLTPQVQGQVLAYVRAGAYRRIAVEAAGVRWSVFRSWSKEEGDTALRLEMTRAAAQARARAEIEVHQKSPLMWLKHGPGRERLGRPGWTNPARPAALPLRDRESNWLQTAGGQASVQAIVEALEGFPDARAVAASVLDGRTKTSAPGA